MTRLQLTKWLRLSLLCISPYNLKRLQTTWHLICSHLFKNHKLVFRGFYFYIVHLSVHCRMTLLILLTKYLLVLYFLSGCLIQNTVSNTPTKCITVTQMRKQLLTYYLHQCALSFYSELNSYFYHLSCSVTTGDVILFSKF